MQLKSTVTAVTTRGEGHFVASFSEIAAVTQGRTFDELVHNLREVVHLALEDENLSDFGLLPNPSILMIYEIPLTEDADR